ncbi:structural maintenance of chromosomes protein 5-like isoform X2 [Solanum dulcamara]|uniref:structural maintenance of chromosomes protein 5-like isoform X2 n=1 Tax=Solanum dulcamara TaxID=45834 RepID=UPI00248567A8|nr:structural maintenance of chromosomes protein 5-like isoform X2 [Solanum dulcamara]
MAFLKLLLYSFLFLQIFTTISSNDSEPIIDSDADSSIRLQLDQLNSKISLLESRIDESTRELRTKDARIKELENTVDLKLAKLASLQSELQLFQEKGSLTAKELVSKANVRATELERQIDVLRRETEAQNEKKAILEISTNEAEEKILELNLKLESLQRINEEQNARIRKTKRALQVAEEEMMKAKLEASSVSEQLEEVKEGWLPPWFAVHFVNFRSIVMTYWNEHGRPALDLTLKKALETKSEVVKMVEPHIHSFKTKWIPAMKERSVKFAHEAGPHIQRLKTKTIHLYHESKKFMEPHIVNAQEVIQPYVQEVRKVANPYVDQVSLVMKPHIEKARVLLQPYTKKVHRHYRKVKKTVSLYHHQAQENIHHMLKNNLITKPYATKELAWYLASALLAVPVIFLLNLVSDFRRKKPKKHSRRHHKSHTRRRAKRAHPDK